MRTLSQFDSDTAADVMIEIATPLTNIIGDEKFVSELRKTMPKGEHTQIEVVRFALQKIVVLLPILLKTHREDTYAVLAPFAEKSVAEIGTQNFLVTLNQIRQLVQDKETVDFFKSWVGGATSAS